MWGVVTRVRPAPSTQTIENKRTIEPEAPEKRTFPVYLTKCDIMRHFVKKLYE